MYVCICNAITEDDVHSCVAAGACTTRQVKQACGWRPGCGSCVGRLAKVIDEAHLAQESAAQSPAA